jgi:ABC-type lipoprotein export system ATPase subunit
MLTTPSVSLSPYIELRDVFKVFKTSAGEFPALSGINLGFERGEFTAIIGKSGSGKSTLINMITGIDHPTSGMVRIGDTELYKMKEGQMAEWRGRNLGIVFQFFQLLPTLTVLENTMLPMDYCNIYEPAVREIRAMELLKLVGLEDVADKLPAALSGGQQQIAAIARSLATDPPIIVADEPTGNLDSRTADMVLNIFEELASKGKTILIVTHDPTLVQRATRRVIISDGELVNEQIFHALPTLSHPQMLILTKLARPHRFESDVVIARQGGVDNGLIFVTSGRVDVIRDRFMRKQDVVTTLQAGDCFSELDLLEIPPTDLTFRSVNGPVDTLCISLDQFNQFLAANPKSEKILRDAAVANSARYNPSGKLKHKKEGQ